MLAALFRFASGWPLRRLHALGGALGWLTWLASPRYRRRLIDNARQAGYTFAQVRGAVAQAGRMALEAPRLWFGPPVPVEWPAHNPIDAAYAAGRGIVFLTPHLGCFEVTVQTTAERYATRYGPITILYRPARQPVLQQVLAQARQRQGQIQALAATPASVRPLLKALRAGQAVGLLPDQVPPQGQGLWAPFFGQPAYTMTLAARLAQQTGATIILAWGERLPRGAGYRLHLTDFPEPLSDDLQTATGQINRAMEGLIRECPGQYLWGYGRYKTPRAEA
ncbi:MAG: lysophospholipid acyltransferase family protein [Burkholderiaceae bacterium]|jgi:KDO2-lipid IV(A) lauroyltransferase|nr:lysophospholipid acyltransferase family protein [Burkholderiaceae bacterium]